MISRLRSQSSTSVLLPFFSPSFFPSSLSPSPPLSPSPTTSDHTRTRSYRLSEHSQREISLRNTLSRAPMLSITWKTLVDLKPNTPAKFQAKRRPSTRQFLINEAENPLRGTFHPETQQFSLKPLATLQDSSGSHTHHHCKVSSQSDTIFDVDPKTRGYPSELTSYFLETQIPTLQ